FLSELRAYLIRPSGNNGKNSGSNPSSKRSKDCHYGVHRKRTGRNGRCRLWLCGQRAGEDNALQKQGSGEAQRAFRNSSRRTDPSFERKRRLDRATGKTGV